MGVGPRFGLFSREASKPGSRADTATGLTPQGDAMSVGLYAIGFAIMICGLTYGAYLVHMFTHWIVVGAIVS